MNVQKIKISEIDIVENIRLSGRDKEMTQLMQSINQHGLEHPIGVAKTKSGRYVLVHGSRRLTACKKLGWVTIPATVIDEPSLEHLIVLNAIENLQRRDVSPFELGRMVARLLELDLTISEISARLNVSESQIEQGLNVFKTVPVKYRERVRFMGKGKSSRDGDLPASVVKKISDVRRQYNLSKKVYEQILDIARAEDLTGLDIAIISKLLDDGMTPEAALKVRKNYSSYTCEIFAETSEMDKLIKKHGKSGAGILKCIAYGEIPAVKKPEFVR